jgi:hypothetical protein
MSGTSPAQAHATLPAIALRLLWSCAFLTHDLIVTYSILINLREHVKVGEVVVHVTLCTSGIADRALKGAATALLQSHFQAGTTDAMKTGQNADLTAPIYFSCARKTLVTMSTLDVASLHEGQVVDMRKYEFLRILLGIDLFRPLELNFVLQLGVFRVESLRPQLPCVFLR